MEDVVSPDHVTPLCRMLTKLGIKSADLSPSRTSYTSIVLDLRKVVEYNESRQCYVLKSRKSGN